jgi:DNA-binding NarL/FixJ family response regulator
MDVDLLRLLIVASDPLARAGLVALLNSQPGFTVAGQVAGETDLLAEIDLYQPELILYDLGWNPAPLLERLLDLSEANLPLVILLPDATYSADAWAARPQGLLLRDASVEKLVAALNGAAQGLVTVDPIFIDSLLPPAQPAPTPPVETLTPRELEVLQHLAEGLPNKAIARRLDISEHTVKFHVNAIMSKLGVQSRTEAVVRATQLGLILL